MSNKRPRLITRFRSQSKKSYLLGLYPKMRMFQRMSANDWQKVTAALAAVEMESFAERQIGELSGGQFQRVLIARTLVQDANYIFLDEPFGRDRCHQ